MPFVQPEKQRSILGEKADDLAEDIYFSMFQFQAKVYKDTVIRNIKKNLRSLMGESVQGYPVSYWETAVDL